MLPGCWLITGATGQLGGHIARLLDQEHPDRQVCAVVHRDARISGRAQVFPLDLADAAAVTALLDRIQPTHIVHAGAVTSVADAAGDPARAFQVNAEATSRLGAWAGQHGARFVYISTDMVFDGRQAPYAEDAPPAPLSVYGRSKRAGEEAIRDVRGAVCVRLPLMYGFPVTTRQTTFVRQVQALQAGEPLRLFTDEYRTPVALADAARAVVAVAESDVTGILHVGGPERLSRYEMVARFAAALHLDQVTLVATSRLDHGGDEPRPADLSLNDRRFRARFPAVAPGPITRERLGQPPRKSHA